MTHKQKVLRLLADGEPHSHMDGYRLGVMLHSRVADLRRDGHHIECWRDAGGLYMYRLVGTLGKEGRPTGSGEKTGADPRGHEHSRTGRPSVPSGSKGAGGHSCSSGPLDVVPLTARGTNTEETIAGTGADSSPVRSVAEPIRPSRHSAVSVAPSREREDWPLDSAGPASPPTADPAQLSLESVA
jgi:hypothetical protein